MAKQKSYKGKKQYKTYQTENRVFENKVKKLTRHCKEFPEDEVGKENLERIKKKGYKCRKKPNVPGSNQTTPKPRPFVAVLPKTAGEQLSELLGIPLPKPAKKSKPKIIRKKKKNVQPT